MKARLVAFWRLSRPHFLVGGILTFLIGTVAGAGTRPIDWGRYAVGQVMVTTAQLTTQYANEYFDRFADRGVVNRTAFSGGSGILPSGLLPPSIALRSAVVAAAASFGTAAAVVATEPVAGLLGVVALAGGILYSAPPLRLAATAFGEIAATLIVAVVVPVIGALLQGDIGFDLAAAMAILAALHGAMILAFALPDVESDAAAGKRNGAVRLGPVGTRSAIRTLLVVAAVALGLAAAETPALGYAAAAAIPGGFLYAYADGAAAPARLTLAAVATFAIAAAGFLGAAVAA